MIPWHIFEELKGKVVRLYIKDLPDPYCILLGKIEEIREQIIIFKDEEHDQLIYVPIKKIVLIKKT